MTRDAADYRVVSDPVYGYVQVPSRLYAAVDSPIVQRLRRVAQTSLTATVYPSATGTRFGHALGTMYLAGRAWDAAWSNASDTARCSFRVELEREVPLLKTALDEDRASFEEEVRWAVMGVGLLHDLGPPAFSPRLLRRRGGAPIDRRAQRRITATTRACTCRTMPGSPRTAERRSRSRRVASARPTWTRGTGRTSPA